ncbi:hypothetical protein [Mangrovimonas sp. TPBH4]|uniref:hypothetical protein n=1 Tax=Mangrovimonas sp. TPBH4 TaxID=1645914 RepID=UPI0006B5AD29|nr:hypothetical protein [Mangrovimonas sp. TPBH4]
MLLKLKEHIKLLAEKYNHKLTYDKFKIIVFSDKNYVEINELNQKSVEITYNYSTGKEKTILKNSDIYDLLIEILTRFELNIIRSKNCELLNISHFIEEEGKVANKRLAELKSEIKNGQVIYRNLGGNRIEAEYYKGILILKDDLMNYKSNVIEFK